MRSISIFIVIIVGVSIQAQSQKLEQHRIDSLLTQLQKVKEDTNKVNLLVDLCNSYSPINPDDGIKYGKQALSLAEKLNWKTGIANADVWLGYLYYQKSDNELLTKYSLKALELYTELDNKIGISKSLNELGIASYAIDDYPKALDFWLKSLKLRELYGSKKDIAGVLQNIGNVYFKIANYPKALEYYFKAIKYLEQTEENFLINISLNSIGYVYFELKDYTKALEYYNKSLAKSKLNGYKVNELESVGYLGQTYNEIKEYSKSLENLFNSLKLSKEIGDKFNYSWCQFILGEVYLSIAKDSNSTYLKTHFAGNRTAVLLKAKAYTDSSISLSKKLGIVYSDKEIMRTLSEIQSLLGDYKGALESYELYSAFKDSTFNLEKDKKITQKALQYEFDKKEAFTKAEQDKKDTTQRVILISILLGLLSMIVFAIVFYNQRNKVKIEKKRSEDLLLNILPEEVVEEIKLTGSAVAKQYNDVTVLFTDFVNFTGISQQLSPSELVAEIHKNFTAFDDIIEKNGLEKIKTIGDAYMAVCGLPNISNDHALRVVKAAIEIRDYVNKSNGLFQIRIGINSGEVVAGIVGVKKFAYDIWGDTVNTASRMEANSESGKINISGSTYSLIKNEFNCEYRGKISTKGKGEVDMYFVVG